MEIFKNSSSVSTEKFDIHEIKRADITRTLPSEPSIKIEHDILNDSSLLDISFIRDLGPLKSLSVENPRSQKIFKSAVLSLTIKYKEYYLLRSAALIGTNLALTTSANLLGKNNESPDLIYAISCSDSNECFFGVQKVFKIFPLPIIPSNTETLVVLYLNQEVGKSAGWFGMIDLPSSSFKHEFENGIEGETEKYAINISGHSNKRNKSGRNEIKWIGRSGIYKHPLNENLKEDFFLHNFEIDEEQIGAPIWINFLNSYYLVGINSSLRQDNYRIGIKLNKEKIDYISKLSSKKLDFSDISSIQVIESSYIFENPLSDNDKKYTSSEIDKQLLERDQRIEELVKKIMEYERDIKAKFDIDEKIEPASGSEIQTNALDDKLNLFKSLELEVISETIDLSEVELQMEQFYNRLKFKNYSKITLNAIGDIITSDELYKYAKALTSIPSCVKTINLGFLFCSNIYNGEISELKKSLDEIEKNTTNSMANINFERPKINGKSFEYLISKYEFWIVGRLEISFDQTNNIQKDFESNFKKLERYKEDFRIGNYEQSFQGFQESVKILNNKEKITLIANRNNLAELCLLSGKYKEAFENIEYAYKLVLIDLEDNPVEGIILNNFIRVIRVLSNPDLNSKMGEYFEKVFKIKDQYLGSNSSSFIKSKLVLAAVNLFQSKFSEAERIITENLKIQRKLFEDIHPEVADSLYLLSQLYLMQNKRDQALDILLECRDIRTKFFKDNHIQCAEICEQISDLMITLQKGEPLLYAETAIKVYFQLFSKYPLQYANYCHKVSLLFIKMKNKTKAIEVLKVALDIYKKLKGENDPKYREMALLLTKLMNN